ncbi:MAG: hypothetical protein K9M45_10185 [Kiritimatiellales bacterium]|nr:hypothetical protein [Kiritimatiellales bacterium]
MKHGSAIKHIRWAGAVFGVLILVAPGSAKVFRWLGPGGNDELNNGSLPWESAYQTKMTVNGRKSIVKLYSARHSEPVVDQLKARFEAMGAKVTVARSSGGATGVARWPDRNAGFLIISPPGEPVQQIIVYQPEPGSFAKQVSFPVPEYQRGRVLSTLSDDQNGTFLATIETTDSATEVHSFYAGSLIGNGWEMAAPALVKNGTISGMAVYTKKKEVCYVQAADRPGKPNIITLLVKGGAI